jgi:hypothetical protein
MKQVRLNRIERAELASRNTATNAARRAEIFYSARASVSKRFRTAGPPAASSAG